MYILFLFFFFSSCCGHQAWVLQKAVTDCPEFNAACLTHVCTNRFNGIEFQLLQGIFGLRGYLQVFAGQILSMKPHACSMWIHIDGSVYTFEGILMDGYQKVLLPQEATSLIIDSLNSQLDVIICLEGYSVELKCHLFSKLFPKMN